MKVSAVKPPPCGLQRTTRPHPSAPDVVPAGILVNLHTCERAEMGPEIHLPKFNAFNRWEWCREGHVVTQLSWLESLIALPPEGFYLLRDDLRFSEATWPQHSLVQLGYDRAATPILFLAQRKHHLSENNLVFAEKGVPILHEQLELVVPVVVNVEPDPNEAGGEAPHAA
jgi:hypothetical protein